MRQENDKIVKLRLPHPEWAGEEADYLSYSVSIIGVGGRNPRSKGTAVQPRCGYRKGQQNQSNSGGKWELRQLRVKKARLTSPFGYLAGYKGFAGDAEAYTGSGYTAEFMLMRRLERNTA